MSKLQSAITVVLGTFQEYAGVEGKKTTLTKAELKTMMEKEMPEFLQGGGDADKKAKVEQLFSSLDMDGDAEVDFTEFMVFLASFMSVIYELTTKQ